MRKDDAEILKMFQFELRFLEDEIMTARSSGRDTHEMIGRLNRLEKQANDLRIPPTYASMLYMLRDHIDLVREGLKKHPGKVA